jgi:hypothetical protein
MRILRLWAITSFIFGIGEIVRAWYVFEASEQSPKSIFQLRFWEILLAGSMQKIVSDWQHSNFFSIFATICCEVMVDVSDASATDCCESGLQYSIYIGDMDSTHFSWTA